MIKKYAGRVEWGLLVVLIYLCCNYSLLAYGSFFPVQAHKQSERSYHYGPSKIVKQIDFKGVTIFLCRYKNWYSADTVYKGWIKWYPGGGVAGKPIRPNERISYSWAYSKLKNGVALYRIYGYVNDRRIQRLKLAAEVGPDADAGPDKSTAADVQLEYRLDSSRMFIFYWDNQAHPYTNKTLLGLDAVGTVIFEKKL